MVMAMGYGGGGSKSKMTYSKSSKRKQPGTYHTNSKKGGNFDEGMQAGFGGDKKGVRREASGLANDDGAGGGKFVDTFNDQSGDAHGGNLKPLRGSGGGYGKMSKKNSSY